MTFAYAYTGDIKELIPAGYKFQMLYANRYKTYSRNDIIMFVVSKMAVEIENVKSNQQVVAIDFILDNLDKTDEFWQSRGVLGWMLPNYVVSVHAEILSRGTEFGAGESPFLLTLEFINDIKVLNKLGLEKKEI